MTARLGDWLQTYSGRRFWPLDPRPDEVEIADIAHALAHQCRYGGHVRRFYSVAEHCVLLAEISGRPQRLAALMHDAAEAYLVDLPRPIKVMMPAYRTAEAAIWLAICARFGIDPELPGCVHEFDRRILVDEFAQAMAPMPIPIEESGLRGVLPLGVQLRFWSPAEAEFHFIRLFDELTDYRFAANSAFHNSGPSRGGAVIKARAEAWRNG